MFMKMETSWVLSPIQVCLFTLIVFNYHAFTVCAGIKPDFIFLIIQFHPFSFTSVV